MKKLEKYLGPFGSKPGLNRIKKLLTKLGNPEKNLKVILISGTNGKGSTTTYLSSILKKAGFKVGSFFSPHLTNYRERIKINGEKITEKDFRKYVDKIIRYFKNGNEITFFEALTTIAYNYFSNKKCDYAIMEIGMGGRLDASNIAKEDIAIITNIGKDHTKWLGNKIEDISKEKIGILKNKILITGAEGKALEVIRKIVLEKKKKIYALGELFKIKNVKTNEKGTEFDYIFKYRVDKNSKYKHDEKLHIKLKMRGTYQSKNASLAITASKILGINNKIIQDGIKNSKINGRLEIINNNQKILVDVAHNPYGTRELVKNLKYFDYEKIILLFGVMKDKIGKK